MSDPCYMCGSDDGMVVIRRDLPFMALQGSILMNMRIEKCNSCGDESCEIPKIAFLIELASKSRDHFCNPQCVRFHFIDGEWGYTMVGEDDG